MSFMPQAFSFDPKENKYQIGQRVFNRNNSLTGDDVSFALEFVMDFALKLQDFKF
jgi:hypothetical protein